MNTELYTKGCVDRNEDYCKVVKSEGVTIAVLADGMGGLSLGREAAECVCNNLAKKVAWQGNVRLYIGNGEKREQVTTDHVIDSGYGQKMLTRCLRGRGLRDCVPTLKRTLSNGDMLYLCTDGYYNMVGNDDATCLTLCPEEIRR